MEVEHAINRKDGLMHAVEQGQGLSLRVAMYRLDKSTPGKHSHLAPGKKFYHCFGIGPLVVILKLME